MKEEEWITISIPEPIYDALEKIKDKKGMTWDELFRWSIDEFKRREII